MEHEQGDDYLRRLATFIRNNEKSLAETGFTRRRRTTKIAEQSSVFNPLGWFGTSGQPQPSVPPPKPVILALDSHHLFYVLMRLEALGIDIGTLDVQVDSPSRPMSYINIFVDSDKSDTLSLASFRSSLSAVSGLSLGGGWWGRPEPPSVDAELKYIYSCFTKLPALSVNAPSRKVITELADEPPNQNALPLDAFKNLYSLECVDIDPRSLLGWDKLAESLRSLKIKKSGLEDVSDIFIGAVVDDQARREGSTSRKRRRRIPRGPARETSFYRTRLPDSVPEDADEDIHSEDNPPVECAPSPPPSTQLSSLKWAFLKHLSLTDNALTFFPAESISYLTSVTHLDLSSNLLVSVPSGLSALYNLVSLNLSDNMIDSVLGIYTNLGQVLHLNLSRNRLESICGLERLLAIERIDLRHNIIEESAEIGRLSTLPNIAEVWVEGNPFVELEEGYRITCFDYFWKEGKSITLDGTSPGFYEKRNLTIPPPQQMSSSRPISTVYSPPVVAVGHPHPHSSPSFNALDAKSHSSPQSSSPTSVQASPSLAPLGVGVGGKARRKKNKRIVELDGERSDDGSTSISHVRARSDGSSRVPTKFKGKKDKERAVIDDQQALSLPKPVKVWGQFGQLGDDDQSGASPVPPQLPSNTVTPTPSKPALGAIKVTIPAQSMQRTTTSATIRPTPRSRHSRYQTEFTPSTSAFNDVLPITPTQSTSSGAPIPSPSSDSRRPTMGSATFSSRSAARRSRVSASVYDPPMADDGDSSGDGDIKDGADAYRRRIEALRKDMGDGWLKVFTQSQMGGATSGQVSQV